MEFTPKEVKKIYKHLSRRKTPREIAKHYGWSTEAVQEVFDQFLYEQIANSPRIILSKMIHELMEASGKSLKKYKRSEHSQDAFAVTSLMNEIRAAMVDLQKMLDVNELADQFIDQVLQGVIVNIIKMFTNELNGIRGELQNLLDPNTFRTVNDSLLDCLDIIKGKINPMYVEMLEEMEKTFNIRLDDRKNELLNVKSTKPKLRVLKTGTDN